MPALDPDAETPAPRVAPPVARDGERGASARIWAPLLALVALAAAALIVASSIGSVVYDARSDEGYYLDYMTKVGEHGLGAFPGLFRDWVADEEAWICPPPTRIGFIAVSALWSRIFGASFASLSYLSMTAFLALIVVQYVYATRYFGRERGAWIAALTAFSPLYLGLARQALTDSLITLFAALSVWLFLDLVHHPDRIRSRVAFVAVFTFAILVKELSVFLAIPFAAFVLIERFAQKEPLPLAHFAWMLALPPVLVLGTFLLASGDVSILERTIEITLESPSTNKYALQYGSGPWYRYCIDYMLLSPWVTLLAILSLGAFAWRLKRGEYSRDLVLFALLPVCLLLAFSSFTKNVRYVAVLELPIRIFAVFFLEELLRTRKPNLSTALCTIAVLVLCFADWRTFRLVFLEWNIADPMTGVLGVIRKLVPGGR